MSRRAAHLLWPLAATGLLFTMACDGDLSERATTSLYSEEGVAPGKGACLQICVNGNFASVPEDGVLPNGPEEPGVKPDGQPGEPPPPKPDGQSGGPAGTDPNDPAAPNGLPGVPPPQPPKPEPPLPGGGCQTFCPPAQGCKLICTPNALFPACKWFCETPEPPQPPCDKDDPSQVCPPQPPQPCERKCDPACVQQQKANGSFDPNALDKCCESNCPPPPPPPPPPCEPQCDQQCIASLLNQPGPNGQPLPEELIKEKCCQPIGPDGNKCVPPLPPPPPPCEPQCDEQCIQSLKNQSGANGQPLPDDLIMQKCCQPVSPDGNKCEPPLPPPPQPQPQPDWCEKAKQQCEQVCTNGDQSCKECLAQFNCA